ncbi:hypothetical protein Hypma_005662 [Hypsizygus marmoreus]|uniref:HECT-type E3 ubiquitin transferase n=1 Tax=Hypsizygus marmoreus TaxID=39966 RepID=A0A369K1L8_HYPMA|nr:hypothetical protein Hypma_005662 [Hypsizygus marmoreus]
MYPLFDDSRKRKINLGGASSASSHSAILDQARAQRNERLEQKRRQENALKLQAWWRGLKEARRTRTAMRTAFEGDITSIMGLRCLVLIGGKDEEALAIWSSRIMQSGPELLFSPALDGQPELQQSWLVLIRRVCFLLVCAVAKAPSSTHAASHLKVLNILLSPTATRNTLGDVGLQVTADITQYLLKRDFYSYLSKAIRGIPTTSRSSPALPLLVSLATLPFQTYSSSAPPYVQALNAYTCSILTIPLLPNRLPVSSLTVLSAQTPFSQFGRLEHEPLIQSTIEDRIHLVANLQAFVPPRYKLLPTDALSSYFTLLTSLINSIPAVTLHPTPQKRTPTVQETYASDSDSDSEPHTRVAVVSTFTPSILTTPPPPPDPKTLKRITSLSSSAHIASLLSLRSPAIVPLLFSLSTVWPSILVSILASSPGLLRQLYREHVRGSILGREDGGDYAGALMDPANGPKWPGLLLLADLYNKALMTMGDDEFFGTSSSSVFASSEHTLASSGPTLGGGSASVQAARNPLSLDELVSFSRQLLNIAFVLYWREDAEVMKNVVGGAVRCTWEGVRERVTRCLVGIHARDSRRPFVPPDHWLVTSQIDMQSFVEAAIFEEQQLSSSPTSSPSPTPALPSSRPSTRTYTKRQLAYLSPRLGILNNIPFAIPFDVRVSIFRHFVLNDVLARSSSPASVASAANAINPLAALRGLVGSMGGQRGGMGGTGKTRVQVRRGSVAQDGFDRLADADLKAPVEITFVDQFGAEEAGIDGGGVFKEFFTSLCKEVFDTDRGLWLANKKNELYPNPHAYATEGHSLNWYRFIGRILGKAMYEGILVDVAFAGFFLAKWLGKQSFLDDLASLDPDLYNGLIFLKHYTGPVEELSLNFTVAIDEFGVTKTIDLIPDGSNVAVTKDNRLQYIQLVSHYRLSKQIKLQSEAFFEGLSEMIDPKWIRMFNQQEIQILLGGVNAPIDFDDLRANTNYGGLYDDNEETIVAFWNVVNSFDQEQRMALLRFVTSCSRPPLLGFKELVPNFSIRDAGSDQLRLPTSSTCVNLLKLPRYKSKKVLRDKLLQAINANAGFDLS